MDFEVSPPKRQRTRESSPDLPSYVQRIQSAQSGPNYGTVDTYNVDTFSPPPAHETVPTQIINRETQKYSQHFTQPTQIIDRNHSPHASSPLRHNVQVPASSPTSMPAKRPMSMMKPAGTAYKAPHGIVKQPSAPNRVFNPIFLDDEDEDEDEGPKYRGGSSDSDGANFQKHDIKTSTFVPRAKPVSEEKIAESPRPGQDKGKFAQLLGDFNYDASAKPKPNLQGSLFDSRNRSAASSTTSVASAGSGVKRLGDDMANAYGGHTKKIKQTLPSRALPVQKETYPDMELDDIQDYNHRKLVDKLHNYMAFSPKPTIREAFNALSRRKWNFDDAVDHIAAEREKKKPVDLTGSEDELLMTPMVTKQKPQAKQQVKDPIISIRDKYGSTQVSKKPLPVQVEELQPKPPPKGRKLIRGRKHASSPAPEDSPPKPITIDSASEAEDSGLPESDGDYGTFDGRAFSFLNTCSLADLMDTASCTKDEAEHIISKRPFKTLAAIRKVEAATAKSSKSKRKVAPIGDRIVDKCYDMIEAYEAVDLLVRKCENMAKPIERSMKGWGIDVVGSRAGELELTSINSPHDSGIGTPASDLGDEVRPTKSSLITQPSIMADDMKMKDYQVVGINWLYLLFRNNLSCILADDMGLGKTCQVIAFLAHLLEKGRGGPHLIVVPSSTLENWLVEFKKFCPELNVLPLYGGINERPEIRDQIDDQRDEVNVVITTYATARSPDDFKWLRKFGFTCTVFDEGHYLKNANSQLYTKLIRIRSDFRLLLTGTPLQNNLGELISLLGFLFPELFNDRQEDLQRIFNHKIKSTDESHAALLSAQRIARARSMLTPFILRRKKVQVLKDLPTKTRRVEFCDMTASQREIYLTTQSKARDVIRRRVAGEKVAADEHANVMMKLRQAAIHPLLSRRHYTDEKIRKLSKACLKVPQWSQSNPNLIYQELSAYSDFEIHNTICKPHDILHKYALQNEEWLVSGKVAALRCLLEKFIADGHRILVFSQFVMVMDILELVFESLQIPFFRLDGSTKVEERQQLIDTFSADGNTTPVFMLSTKAGGAGINLAKASRVIVFDSGFNPQDDIQAENRAHRIGQTKEVEVVRLVTRGTIEEQIYTMGLTKLALDDKVAGDEDADNVKALEKREKEGMNLVTDMLMEKLENESEPILSNSKKESAFNVESESDSELSEPPEVVELSDERESETTANSRGRKAKAKALKEMKEREDEDKAFEKAMRTKPAGKGNAKKQDVKGEGNPFTKAKSISSKVKTKELPERKKRVLSKRTVDLDEDDFE